MPDYIKSGKYYYEVDKRNGKKIRISKDKFNKSKSNKSNKSNKIKSNKSNKIKSNKIKSNKNLDIETLIKDKIKNINKNKLLSNLLILNFDIVKNNKKYHIDAEVGKDPRSGYYIYRVDVQHIPNNGMSQINAYRSYMVSSNFEILKDLL